jgi:hypothetical protein
LVAHEASKGRPMSIRSGANEGTRRVSMEHLLLWDR